MSSALTRYRVMAYVVGVMLLVLVFVAMPVKYVGGDDTLVAVVGPAHGFLFMVYLVTALNLAVVRRWAPVRTVVVMLAGTIPFLSFVMERKVTREEQAAAAGHAAGAATS